MAKARRQKLKLFRTAAGFNDAYVAAPSRKVALEAWGADSDLFAQGLAEEVADAGPMAGLFERPGAVVKVPRGSMADYVAALDANKVAGRRAAKKREASSASAEQSPHSGANQSRRGPLPRPSRALIEKAERALRQAESRHSEALDRLSREEEALQRKRRKMEQQQRRESERLRAVVAGERDRHRAAMNRWATSELPNR